MNKNLSETMVGEEVTILKILNESKIKRRLYDLGIIKGRKISCVGKSLLNDPSAYMVSGSIIAIRNIDAKKIIVV